MESLPAWESNDWSTFLAGPERTVSLYSPFLPLYFLAASVIAGLSLFIVESTLQDNVEPPERLHYTLQLAGGFYDLPDRRLAQVLALQASRTVAQPRHKPQERRNRVLATRAEFGRLHKAPATQSCRPPLSKGQRAHPRLLRPLRQSQ